MRKYDTLPDEMDHDTSIDKGRDRRAMRRLQRDKHKQRRKDIEEWN